MKFKQVKINIPENEKAVIAYCKRLSAQRILSQKILHLLKNELKAK